MIELFDVDAGQVFDVNPDFLMFTMDVKGSFGCKIIIAGNLRFNVKETKKEIRKLIKQSRIIELYKDATNPN